MKIYLTKNRTKEFSFALFLFIIIYLVFNIEDLGASAQTGNRGSDRTTAHIALLCVTAFLLLYLLFNLKKIRNGKPIFSLIALLFWTSIVNILNGVSTWTLLVQENMSLLWVLSYLFFENVRYKSKNDRSIKSFAWFFFAFFIGAIVYYFFDMYVRLGRIPVINVIYYAIALLPWIFVNRYGNRKLELFLFIIIIAATFLSMKRGAIVAIILMILTYYFIQAVNKKDFSSFGKILLLTLLFIAAFVFADRLSGGYISQRFSSEEMASGSGRFEQYTLAIQALKESDLFSLLFGNGTEKSMELVGKLIHNEWLSFLYCYGIVGLILYATMFFGFVKQSSIIGKMNSDLAAPCHMMTVFYFVLSMVSTGYYGYVGLLLFGFWGFVNAEYRISLMNDMEENERRI